MGLGLGIGFSGGGGSNSNDLLGWLKNSTGLTFFKDYARSQDSADADFSNGSATATVTVARSATSPATYFDASGVIQTTTTANVPRWTQGYYDSTGFHVRKGLMVEAGGGTSGVGINRLTYSYTFANAAWTKTNITVDDAVVDTVPTTTVSSLTAAAGNVALVQAYTDAVAGKYTASIFIKRKTGTGTINLRANTADSYTDITALVDAADRWIRVSVTSSSATNPTFDLQIVTSTDAVYVYGAQLEKYPYMTSFIPTTTAARTRAAEIPSYPILANRTASKETIFIKYTPLGGDWANDGIQRTLTSSDTKNRDMRKLTTGATHRAYANITDNATAMASATTTLLAGTSYVACSTFTHSAPSPYVAVSTDGEREGTFTTADWIDPVWGTSFYIGTASAGNSQGNGIFESIAIYSEFKDVPDVNHISYILTQATDYKEYTLTPSTSSSANLVSGSAGNGNVVTNPAGDYLWMDSYACSDANWIGSADRTGETWRVFKLNGADAEKVGSSAPVGDIVFRTYTKSTNTMSDPPVTAWTDATYMANEILAYRVPSESFIRFYFSMSTRADSTTQLGIYVIKSTDLTCTAWGSPVICISGNVRQPNSFVNLQNGTKALFCTSTGIPLGGKATLFSTTDYDNFVQYSQITDTTSTHSEGQMVGDINGRMICVLRKNEGDYLLQSVSADWGLTWTTPSSTGLGASTGAKVKPKLKIAAGDHSRVMTYFYDRGDNRLKIGTPTKFDDAYAGTWLPTYLIGTSMQGNGGFDVIDDTLLQYLVSNQSGSEPTNDFRWWKFKDIYTWVED